MSAPPSPPLTNAPTNDEEEVGYYSNVPVNKGKYPPVGVLTGLYEKLSKENKHDVRRKLLANWFRVSIRLGRLSSMYYLCLIEMA